MFLHQLSFPSSSVPELGSSLSKDVVQPVTQAELIPAQHWAQTVDSAFVTVCNNKTLTAVGLS